MPVFDYKAVTPQGEIRTGQMAAGGQAEVIAQLQSSGLIPISAQQQGTKVGAVLTRRRGSKIRPNDLAEFTRQLSILTGAGLPLDRSLEIIRSVCRHDALHQMVSEVQESVRGGSTLSKALQQFPGLFSNFYINFIRSAEMSGAMSENLRDLSVYLDKARGLKEQLVSALIYPAVLLLVAIIALIVITVVVLPEFASLFADMGASLPPATAFVMASGQWLRDYGWVLLIVLFLMVLYIRQKKSDDAWRRRWDQRILNNRLLGDLTQKVEMARFSRSLGTLLRGGVPLLGALHIAREALQNRVMAGHLTEVTSQVKDGSDMAGPMLASQVFPDFALQMIQVGEETGQLDEMLLKVAEVYDEEVSIALKRALALVEPAMIIGLGLLIGFIIISVLVAILGINELAI